MAPPKVAPTAPPGEPIFRDVGQLVVGDVIAAAYLPLRRAGRILFVKPFERDRAERWVFVAYEQLDGNVEGCSFLAGEGVRLDAEAGPVFEDGPCQDPDCPNASWPHLASSDRAAADPTGLTYGRGDESPEPSTTERRVQAHWDAAVGPLDAPVVMVPVLDVPWHKEVVRGAPHQAES